MTVTRDRRVTRVMSVLRGRRGILVQLVHKVRLERPVQEQH